MKKKRRDKADPRLAALIKGARERSGLTQDDLAGKTGLTVRGIGYYEQCKRKPDLLPLLQIILALGEEHRAPLVEFVPRQVWLFAALLIEDAAVRYGLDTPAIIIDDLRSGMGAKSLESLADNSPLARSQAGTLNRKAIKRELSAQRSRESHRSKSA